MLDIIIAIIISDKSDLKIRTHVLSVQETPCLGDLIQFHLTLRCIPSHCSNNPHSFAIIAKDTGNYSRACLSTGSTNADAQSLTCEYCGTCPPLFLLSYFSCFSVSSLLSLSFFCPPFFSAFCTTGLVYINTAEPQLTTLRNKENIDLTFLPSKS